MFSAGTVSQCSRRPSLVHHLKCRFKKINVFNFLFLKTLYRNLDTIGVAVDLILLFRELRVEQESLLTGNLWYDSRVICVFETGLKTTTWSVT